MNQHRLKNDRQKLDQSALLGSSTVIAYAQVEWLRMVCRQVAESLQSDRDPPPTPAGQTSFPPPSSRQPKTRRR